MDTYKLKPDAPTRRRFFTEESFQHPAKMACGLIDIIAERYELKPGDLVLDPMAGSGTTMLLALRGINCCLIELESHFVEPMKASWEKMKQQPMLGHEMGQVVILQGDARDLSFLGGVDGIVTSPPFLGQHDGLAGDEKERWRMAAGKLPRIGSLEKPGYTRPDAIVTSPPWEQAPQNKDSAKERIDYGQRGSSYEAAYHHTAENIGNLRSGAYWEAMTAVYSEAFRVLKPSGVMVLVLKGFTRSGEYVNLPAETASLVSDLGFTLFDHWRRELWTLSFWRILQQRRDPEAFDDRLRYEEVLAFRKGEGDGLVEAVITSPPYEGSVDSGNSVRTWTEEAKRRWWNNYRSQGGGMDYDSFIAYQESLQYRYTRRKPS